MLRRGFLQISCIAATFDRCLGQTRSGALSIASSFRPPIIDDEFVQCFAADKGSFLFLLTNRQSRTSRLVCTSLSGAVRWILPLLENQSYTGLGLRPSGMIVLLYFVPRGLETGTYLAEVSENERNPVMVRSLRLPFMTGVREYHVVADSLLGFRDDASVVIFDLWTSARGTLSCGVSQTESIRVHSVADSRALVVDRLEAKLGRLSLPSGPCEWSAIDSPEVTDSRNYFATRQKQFTSLPAGAVVHPPVIGASGVARDGSLYFLVQPVDRHKGAVLLRSDLTGRVNMRYLVRLPSKDVRKLLPHWLTVAQQRMFLIYGDGHVDEYALS